MRLALSTWPEVEDYLQNNRGIVVPVGSTEQHGPAGLIGTDALCPEAIAVELGRRDRVLVAPTLAYGNAQHHMGFAGTVTLRPTTFLAVVRDVVRSLAHHGFERFWFLNGHGGNVAPLETAFAEIHAQSSLDGARPVRCALHNWWEGERIAAALAEFFGDGDGSHGTAGEVSLTWHLHPECVRKKVPDLPGATDSGFSDAADYRRRYPDGRIGSDARLYSAEKGAQLFDLAVAEASAVFDRFLGAD